MVRRIIIFIVIVAGAIAAWALWIEWTNRRDVARRAEQERAGLAFIRAPGNEARMRRMARDACRCARTGVSSHEACWREFNGIVERYNGGAGGAPVHPVSTGFSCFGPQDPPDPTTCIETEFPVWQGPALCTWEEFNAVDEALKAVEPNQVDAEAVRMARKFAEADRARR